MRSMGRTVPTWRRRVEMELEGLEAYRRGLRVRERKALDDLVDAVRDRRLSGGMLPAEDPWHPIFCSRCSWRRGIAWIASNHDWRRSGNMRRDDGRAGWVLDAHPMLDATGMVLWIRFDEGDWKRIEVPWRPRLHVHSDGIRLRNLEEWLMLPEIAEPMVSLRSDGREDVDRSRRRMPPMCWRSRQREQMV